MTGRVIQGFFIGGAMRPQAAPRPAAGAMPPRHPIGAPPPAFAGRSAPLQARMAPGRPPLAHQGAAHVAQPHGGNSSFEIDPVQLGLARGGGKPLPQAVLAKMEAAFGADFSAVRVHVGPQASRIGAIAFTTGNDLYFAPGQFQPDSVKGQQLIGHELAHVVQQRQGRVRASSAGVAIVRDGGLEAEADRLGMRAAAYGYAVQTKPGLVRHGSATALQRSGLFGEALPRAPEVRPAGQRHVGKVNFCAGRFVQRSAPARLEKAITQGDLNLSSAALQLCDLMGWDDLKPKVSPHTKKGTGSSGTDHEARNGAVATQFASDVLARYCKTKGLPFPNCAAALKDAKSRISSSSSSGDDEEYAAALQQSYEDERKKAEKASKYGTQKSEASRPKKLTTQQKQEIADHNAYHQRFHSADARCQVCGAFGNDRDRRED